ncbi:hypothetical protein ACFFX0_03195 [Citricoccus parietis]|uniref:Abasic site processing protein n=1 Tax=Citricoccus parietis TaxID=592307 RepID=A0ABV5FU92_9MICC
MCGRYVMARTIGDLVEDSGADPVRNWFVQVSGEGVRFDSPAERVSVHILSLVQAATEKGFVYFVPGLSARASMTMAPIARVCACRPMGEGKK